MDAFLQKSSPGTSASAPASALASASAPSTVIAGQPITPTPASVTATTKVTVTPSAVDEGLKAWQTLTKSGPVTQATFLAWYATHNKKATKKRSASTSKPAAKKQKQGVLPGADASVPATLTKGKRTALLKAIGTSLKTNIKAKNTRWHMGDRDVKAGTAVMDPSEFAALFPDVAKTKKGVTTSFSLSSDDIADTFGDWKLSVPTFSQPRRGSFQKAYKTGSQEVRLHSAEGKYSTGTSTVTLKFSLSIAGGYSGYGWGGYNEDGDY